MKIRHISILLLVSFILASCGTLVDHRQVGNFKYKGVEYDVYEADTGKEFVRVLVKKGSGRPSSLAFVITSCAVDDLDSNSVTTAKCNRAFGKKLDARSTVDTTGQGDSMY